MVEPKRHLVYDSPVFQSIILKGPINVIARLLMSMFFFVFFTKYWKKYRYLRITNWKLESCRLVATMRIKECGQTFNAIFFVHIKSTLSNQSHRRFIIYSRHRCVRAEVKVGQETRH